jgi:transposase-like protein
MARPPIKPVDDKLRIVLAVLPGEVSVKEGARRERVSETSIAAWRDQFLDGGRAALAAGARHRPGAREAELQAQVEELTSALGEAQVGLRVGRKRGGGRPGLEGLGVIRAEAGLSVAGCCALLGMPRASWYRWRAAVAGGAARPGKGPWPAPVVGRIEPLAARHAERWAAWGHRQVWGLLTADGVAASPSSGRRAMARRGLLQPVGSQAERRQLAKARRAVCTHPPTRRNRVWQTDFSELERLAGGIWRMSGWSTTGPSSGWPARSPPATAPARRSPPSRPRSTRPRRWWATRCWGTWSTRPPVS